MNDANANPNYPAACDHAIAVSATDPSDHLASYSNYGNWIALSAPGSDILSTLNGGGYGYWYGTSFAAPIAAGVAALVLAVIPNLSASELVSLLEQNADDLGMPGRDSYYGWGRVNAFRAVQAAQALAAPPSLPIHRNPHPVPVHRPK
jgi:subtilisin family serine protease